ncbi:MAG: YwiC-like family protein [Bacteroidetes bacterium]|nr:YwiC-like family protein [Bacteroidota bacterium]
MNFPKAVFPVYWSKQHGAYITLIICWMIGVFLSPNFSWLQPVVLVFLLSGFNLVELILEKYKRKTPLPQGRKIWLFIYSIITLLFGLFTLIKVPLLRYLLPVFICSGVIFILLALKRKQKSVFAEWLTFSVFSLSGLLAFSPGEVPELSWIIHITLIMSLYFGLSIFLVKFWLGKLMSYGGLIYVMSAILFMFFFYGESRIVYGVGALMLLKCMIPIVAGPWYKNLPIKRIGMLEAIFHLIFLIILVLNFPHTSEF